jgi:hypothetical protein
MTATAERLRYVDLDVVGDAAEDRVVGGRRLEDRPGHELGYGPLCDEARDEALPRDAATEDTVEPEAAVPCAEDLARADRVRLRRQIWILKSGFSCLASSLRRIRRTRSHTARSRTR